MKNQLQTPTESLNEMFLVFWPEEWTKKFTNSLSLEGIWWVSGRCLEGVWRVSGGCLEGAWEVSEPKMIFLQVKKKKFGPKKLKIKLFTKAKLSLYYLLSQSLLNGPTEYVLDEGMG